MIELRGFFFIFLAALAHGIAAENEIDTMFLRFYNGKTTDTYVDKKLPNADSFLSEMDLDKQTVIYIHGFTESVNSTSTKTVIHAYLKRNDHNTFALDYSVIADRNFISAASSADDVGKALAHVIDKMIDKSLKPEKIYIVGHSLGGEIAGYVGRNTAQKLPRIIGLDPAGPLFYFFIRHLSAADADAVHIVHTDAGLYGIAETIGTADFYPNGGYRIQPGCEQGAGFLGITDTCSHHRSWSYYAESVVDEKAFLAILCPNYHLFLVGGCTGNEIVPMGFATPNDASGSYYLLTNSKSPFGAGLAGTKPGA